MGSCYQWVEKLCVCRFWDRTFLSTDQILFVVFFKNDVSTKFLQTLEQLKSFVLAVYKFRRFVSVMGKLIQRKLIQGKFLSGI